jgi:N-methylhydantoinase A
MFDYSDDDQPIRIHTLQVTGVGPVTKPEFPEIHGVNNKNDAIKTSRDVYFDEIGEFVETTIYDRSKLGSNTSISGPAIMEQMDSTIIIPPSSLARIDNIGNVIIDVGGEHNE